MVFESELRILLDATIAAVLAGVVGLERELRDKPAGLRTNMVIGAVAALFLNLGHETVAFYLHDLSDRVNISTDPIRVFEAIVVGVSFIGAGTIIRSPHGGDVQNLTTAAALLVSAAIGIAVGVHLYIVAVGMALMAWLINWFLRGTARSMINDDVDK